MAFEKRADIAPGVTPEPDRPPPLEKAADAGRRRDQLADGPQQRLADRAAGRPARDQDHLLGES